MHQALAAHVATLLASAPGQAIGLSALGRELRRWRPGFHPRAYGHHKLLDLIATLEVCSLEVDPSGLHWTVVGNPASEASDEDADVGLLDEVADGVADGVAGAVADGVAGGAAPLVRRTKIRVQAAWWALFVDDDGGAWYDLATGTPTSDADAVAAEPERYIPLPRWDAAREATLSAADATPAQRRKIGPTLRKAIVAELLAWSQRHGVPAHAWQEPTFDRAALQRNAALSPAARGRTSPASATHDDVRQQLMTWVAACSDDEIAAIATVIASLQAQQP